MASVRAEKLEHELLRVYENCIKSRLLDEKLQELYYEGRTHILFSGIGAEVGPSIIAALLEQGDYFIPHYRGYATILGRGVRIEKIIGEKIGKNIGLTRGIGDAAPFRDPEHNILGYTINLGTNFSIAVGVGLAVKLKKEDKIVAVFFGDGEASRNTLGGALNFASLWHLPILFVCLNNGVSISTPIAEMSSTKTVAERARGYHVETETISETEISHLYERTQKIVTSIRDEKQPFLLEIKQKRFPPHSSNYDNHPFLGSMIPKDEDPLFHLETFLRRSSVSNTELFESHEKINNLIESAFAEALNEKQLSEEDFFSIYHDS